MTRKSQEHKDFLIATRKKTSAGTTSAPVWIMRKAGKRIYSKKGKRHWRQTTLSKEFRKKQKEQGKVGKGVKSGKKGKARMYQNKGKALM